ncbi:MAG: PD-(D/E)XK nuclease family protein [Deltaproteobacteria bacterium]|nr:PD-(D/E)XK nuclease family protein [Deltaproteobacteria bacterium]
MAATGLVPGLSKEFFALLGRLIPGEDVFERISKDGEENNERLRRVHVFAERGVEAPADHGNAITERRCDIWLELIEEGRSIVVVIENKIDAGEHGAQLSAYEQAVWQWARQNRRLSFEAKLVFLTPDGRPPDGQSDQQLWVAMGTRNWRLRWLRLLGMRRNLDELSYSCTFRRSSRKSSASRPASTRSTSSSSCRSWMPSSTREPHVSDQKLGHCLPLYLQNRLLLSALRRWTTRRACPATPPRIGRYSPSFESVPPSKPLDFSKTSTPRCSAARRRRCRTVRTVRASAASSGSTGTWRVVYFDPVNASPEPGTSTLGAFVTRDRRSRSLSGPRIPGRRRRSLRLHTSHGNHVTMRIKPLSTMQHSCRRISHSTRSSGR